MVTVSLSKHIKGKELDDWSGKKTVKTGQQERRMTDTATNLSSVETDPDLLSPLINLRPRSWRLQTCEESDASYKSDSSSEGSSDDNSISVLNEGRFGEQPHDSDSDDGETIDDLSFNGLDAGCFTCGDLHVNSPARAHAYWKRVTANRKTGTLLTNTSIQEISVNYSESESEVDDAYTDKTEIEVVHAGTDVEPTEHQTNKPKSPSFRRRLVQSLSNNARVSLSVETIRSMRDRNASSKRTIHAEDFECPSQRVSLSNLGNIPYTPKVVPPHEQSCASLSSEDKWACSDDKCKTQEKRRKEVVNLEAENVAIAEVLAVLDDLHNNVTMEDPTSAVLIPPKTSSTVRKRRSSIRASIGKAGMAAKRAMRSRASLMRAAKNMRYDSAEFSDRVSIHSKDTGTGNASKDGASATTIEKLREQKPKPFRLKLTKCLRLIRICVKRGVSRLKKLGKDGLIPKTRAPSGGLIVCIDGKGDRLRPSNARPSEEDNTGTDSRESGSTTKEFGASDSSSVSESAASGLDSSCFGHQPVSVTLPKYLTPVTVSSCFGHQPVSVTLPKHLTPVTISNTGCRSERFHHVSYFHYSPCVTNCRIQRFWRRRDFC
jgi:hypothetical protein